MGAMLTLPWKGGDVTAMVWVGPRACLASVAQHTLSLPEWPQARSDGRDTAGGQSPPTRTLAPTHAGSQRLEWGVVGQTHGVCSPSFPVLGCTLGVHKGEERKA